MTHIDELFNGSDAHLLKSCCICGEESIGGYCEDCRDNGNLEDVLESALDDNAELRRATTDADINRDA